MSRPLVPLNEHLKRRRLSRQHYYDHRHDRRLYPRTIYQGPRIYFDGEEEARYPLPGPGRPRKTKPDLNTAA